MAADVGRLHLRAELPDEVPLLSALVQDMAVLASAVDWQTGRRTLIIAGSRFRHEVPEPPTRIASVLRLVHVAAVQRRAWPVDPEAVLALLAITMESDDVLLLTFGGGAALRCTIEVVDLTLEDRTDPWPALGVPDHEDRAPA